MTVREASALSPLMLLIARYLLAIGAHANDNEQQDRGCLAVEPHAHRSTIENEPHDRLTGERAGVPRVPVALRLVPHPAHHVLADRSAE